MPVYKKGKGKWTVRIWKNGVRQDWIVNGKKSEAEAFEARKRVELESADPESLQRNVPRLSHFCATKYRPHAETHLKPSTWRKQIYLVATLSEHFGHRKLTEFRPAHIETYKQKRLAHGLKPVSVNNELRVLRRILTFASELGFPVADLKWRRLTERSDRAIVFWTRKEMAKLFEACLEKAPDILPMVVCLANTGMRAGEALALRWEDVDLEQRVIRIQYHQNDGWSPKSDRWRDVPINDTLLSFLRRPRKSETWVFPCSKTGKRYAGWPQRKFNKARDKAGLKGGAHRLRHSYASHFLAQVPDLYLLSKVLGHTHSRTTTIYAHLLPESMNRARVAVDFSPDVSAAECEAKQRWSARRFSSGK